MKTIQPWENFSNTYYRITKKSFALLKKIEVDDYFWDILAIDKKNRDDWYIEYDDYSKYWIKDWICKKDFLYYNL